MKVSGRSNSARLALACRALALVVLVALLGRHGVQVAALSIGLGLLLVPVAWRRRGDSATGALYAASADQVLGTERWSGQLSVTGSSVAWMPSGHSRRHDIAEVSITASREPVIEVQRGPALMDMTLTVKPGEGDEYRFVTRHSRRLVDALSGVEIQGRNAQSAGQ